MRRSCRAWLFVLCVDNLSTGSLENVASLQADRQFRFLRQDVLQLDRERLKAHDLDHEFRYVFHLASPASVVDYLRLPLETLLVNGHGTQRLLDLAGVWGATFVYTSTSESTATPSNPQSETYWGNVDPNGPRSCYDKGKRFGEAITAQYVRSFGLDARIVASSTRTGRIRALMTVAWCRTLSPRRFKANRYLFTALDCRRGAFAMSAIWSPA